MDGYLAGRDNDYTNDDLVANSNKPGMDCAVPFHFFHCELRPGNVIVRVKNDAADDESRSIAVGIIDGSGSEPSFALASAGLDLPWEGYSRLVYRRRVKVKMGELGFLDVVVAWWIRWGAIDYPGVARAYQRCAARHSFALDCQIFMSARCSIVALVKLMQVVPEMGALRLWAG